MCVCVCVCVFQSHLLLYTNAHANKALIADATLSDCEFEGLSHPPYSPDLAPCHFHPFPNLRGYLCLKHFDDVNELKTATKEWLRYLYTKSNPIDDHDNISSKKVTESEFQTIGPLYLHAVWYLPFINSPRKDTVTYHFSDLHEVYSGNRQIHTKCQVQ